MWHMTPSRSIRICDTVHWKILLAKLMPKGSWLKQKWPNGVMKVVRSLDSGQSGICQKPLLASSLLKILLCPSLARLRTLGGPLSAQPCWGGWGPHKCEWSHLVLAQPLCLSTSWLAWWQVRWLLVFPCSPAPSWPLVLMDAQSSLVHGWTSILSCCSQAREVPWELACEVGCGWVGQCVNALDHAQLHACSLAEEWAWQVT